MEKLTIFRGQIVHIMGNVSGRAEPDAELLLVAILWYIVIILLLVMIHRRIVRKHERIHENLVFLYDTIRYQVARVQASNPIIQDNKGIKVIMESEHKNYLANSTAIKEEINLMEQKLGQQIVSADQRTTITKQSKKKRTLMILVQLLWRIITVLTVGIYKLFW